MENKINLLKSYSRAIAHMRNQIKHDRFGLVFGAGISRDFGFPLWNELIKRIGKNKKVNGNNILDAIKSKTSVSQLLYQSYRTKEFKKYGNEYSEYDKFNSHVQAGWHQIVHDALYKDVPNDIEKLQNLDKYICEYFDIIKKIKLTVNYNFDDTIQLLLAHQRTEDEKKSARGFRTVWDSDIQLYPQQGVIYHPNGYLPQNINDRTSDELIFLEDSFSDQLIDSVSGHYSLLSYYFSQNTCLFLGHSLEDSTLKHLLRKNAQMHPGHVHYYVYFLKDGTVIDEEHKKAIIDANFEVYNLITLFLTAEEIKNLAKLIKCEKEDYEMISDRAGTNTSYKFFLTGSVCVGKSTATTLFRSLQTHDEWLEPRIDGMEKDPSLLTDEEKIKQIDEWVVDQWQNKNFHLSRKASHGVHIIDRCALDAFAFTPESKWVEKATFTIKGITPDSSRIELVKGAVILLIGDPDIMAVRALKLNKSFTSDKLDKMQNLLKIVYNDSVQGIIYLDTRNKTPQRVAKQVARIIHITDYEECDLQKRLVEIETGIVKPDN